MGFVAMWKQLQFVKSAALACIIDNGVTWRQPWDMNQYWLSPLMLCVTRSRRVDESLQGLCMKNIDVV